jgi:peptide/nickel transport system permease protein
MVTIIVFGLLHIVPGDPVYAILGASQVADLTEEDMQRYRHEWGLDRPIYIQYLSWLGKIARGDLGQSIVSSKEPVIKLLLVSLKVTIPLALGATLFGCTFGIAFGFIGALRPNTKLDMAVTTMAIGGISIPSFWEGIVAIYIFAVWLHWLPAAGWVDFSTSPIGWFKCLIMPMIIMGTHMAGSYMRYTRSALLEVLDQDYIRTARAKGLREKVVILKHGFRSNDRYLVLAYRSPSKVGINAAEYT